MATRYCWCGRELAPGELCAETYDGHIRRDKGLEADAAWSDALAANDE